MAGAEPAHRRVTAWRSRRVIHSAAATLLTTVPSMTTTSDGAAAAAAAGLLVSLVGGVIGYVVGALPLWGVFRKAGDPAVPA